MLNTLINNTFASYQENIDSADIQCTLGIDITSKDKKKIFLKANTPITDKISEKIKQLSDEMQAERKRLIQDEQGTEKYKDDAYYKFIDMLDGEELAIGLKGIAKIQIAE